MLPFKLSVFLEFESILCNNHTPKKIICRKCSGKSIAAKNLAEKVPAHLDAKECLALILLDGEGFSVAEVANNRRLVAKQYQNKTVSLPR